MSRKKKIQFRAPVKPSFNSVYEQLHKRKFGLKKRPVKHKLHPIPIIHNSNYLNSRGEKSLEQKLKKQILGGNFPMVKNCDLKLGRAYMGFFVPLLDSKGNLIFEKSKIGGNTS